MDEITRTLTGQQRYRQKKRLFGAPLLVLQVEVRESGVRFVNYNVSIEAETIDRTFWRDAEPGDFLPVPMAA
jgi:hypothetical protein